MNAKFVTALVMFALVASMGMGMAYNEGDSGVAYPGVPCVTPITGGDCVNVYEAHTGLEAATLGWDGYEEGAAYAGRPYVSVKPY